MNVKEFEKKEKNTAELTVVAAPEEFDAAVQKAYLKGRGRIQIPGFRKGKAPRKMIEAMYGQGVFYEDAVGSGRRYQGEGAVHRGPSLHPGL